jgi:alkylated DNA repair dioxygenase AlkB
MKATPGMAAQAELFPDQPAGFGYHEEVITQREEEDHVRRFADLPFKPFEFHGHLGKRCVVVFGWRYDYAARTLSQSDDFPDWLSLLRERAAAVARLPAEELQQVLVTEYAAGAGIGWHRDRPMFETVIAVSFLSPCVLRLRRKDGASWRRRSKAIEPRSAYCLRGPARHDWEHSVPPVASLRYSVTFRNFADRSEGG